MAKVFVGNFSFAVDEAKLREFFSKVGSVISAKVMTEGPGGRSRGFGFVELSTPEEAAKAIAELDGTVWEGRVIKVSEDRSTRRHEDHHGGDGRREGGFSGGGHRDGGSGGDYDRGDRHQPTGYFRAQPLDIGLRKKKKSDPFLEDENLKVDYKDPKLLSRFLSERGRILPRRMTGLTATHQRMVSRAIKRSQQIGLMPYVRD